MANPSFHRTDRKARLAAEFKRYDLSSGIGTVRLAKSHLVFCIQAAVHH